jgi:hypothetical protein
MSTVKSGQQAKSIPLTETMRAAWIFIQMVQLLAKTAMKLKNTAPALADDISLTVLQACNVLHMSSFRDPETPGDCLEFCVTADGIAQCFDLTKEEAKEVLRRVHQ